MAHSTRQLLFACDFGDAARAALKTLSELSAALDARVLLVHVQHSGWRSWLSSGLADRHAQDRLESWADQLRELGVDARAEMLTDDDIAATLALVAQREGAFAIVVGGEEHPGGKSRFEDRTVENLVRLAKQPVWVLKARDGKASAPRRILCGVDPSEESADALQLAARIASPFGAAVTAVHAVSNPTFSPLGMSPEEEEREHVAHKQRMRQQLEAFVADQSLPVAATRVQWGAPAEVLLHMARDEDFDLIVLGPGRKSSTKRALLGSTAGKVMYEAPVSVLLAGEGGVVRAQRKQPPGSAALFPPKP